MMVAGICVWYFCASPRESCNAQRSDSTIVPEDPNCNVIQGRDPVIFDMFWYDLVHNATSPTLGHHSILTYCLFKPVPAYMSNDALFGFSSPIYRRHIDVLSWLFGKITLAHSGSGDFMHAETGGIAGALIPPANYSGSGLGKSDLGHLARENASVMNMVGPVVSVQFLIFFVYVFWCLSHSCVQHCKQTSM